MLAMELARHGVPGGIVTQASEPATRRAALGKPGEAERLAFRERLPEMARLVSGGRSGFKVTGSDGVVHIRSDREPPGLMALLDRSLGIPEKDRISVSDALSDVVIAGILGYEPKGGIVGGGPQPVEECFLEHLVLVTGGSRTVMDVLDEIVSQLPDGIVWLVTYDPEHPTYDLKVGFICGVGYRTTRSVPY